MGFKSSELTRILGHLEVACPSPIPPVDVSDSRLDGLVRPSRRQCLDLLHRPIHGERRDGECPHNDCHSEELDPRRQRYLAFLPVDRQFHPFLEQFRDARHHTLGRLAAANEDVAVVRVSTKRKSPTLQFLVQLIKHYVAQQRTQRAALRRAFRGGDKTSRGHHAATQRQADQPDNPVVGHPLLHFV